MHLKGSSQPSSAQTLFHFVLHSNFPRLVLWSHFTDKKMEFQRDSIACLRSHSWYCQIQKRL